MCDGDGRPVCADIAGVVASVRHLDAPDPETEVHQAKVNNTVSQDFNS